MRSEFLQKKWKSYAYNILKIGIQNQIKLVETWKSMRICGRIMCCECLIWFVFTYNCRDIQRNPGSVFYNSFMQIL